MKSTMMRLAAALAAVGTLLAAVFLLAAPANASTTGPGGGTGGVRVSNPHPKAGGNIVVSGRGCTPGATVTVFFDSQELATGKVNPAGHYSIPVRIPGDAVAGHHTISIKVGGGSCPGSGVLGIEVQAANGGGSSGGSGGLASTGVAVVGIGALGVVLLAGGAMMLLAGRRRTHA